MSCFAQGPPSEARHLLLKTSTRIICTRTTAVRKNSKKVHALLFTTPRFDRRSIGDSSQYYNYVGIFRATDRYPRLKIINSYVPRECYTPAYSSRRAVVRLWNYLVYDMHIHVSAHAAHICGGEKRELGGPRVSYDGHGSGDPWVEAERQKNARTEQRGWTK